jgi:hypothetical protein
LAVAEDESRMLKTIKEFIESLFPKDSLRRKFVESALTKGVLAGTCVLILFIPKALRGLIFRGIGLDAKGNLLVSGWLIYALTVLVAGVLVLIAFVVFFVRFHLKKVTSVHREDHSPLPQGLDRITNDIQLIIDHLAPKEKYVCHKENKIFKSDSRGNASISVASTIASPHQPIALIPVEAYCTEPVTDIIFLQSKTEMGRVVSLPGRNEPSIKEWLLYFSPPVSDSNRNFSYEFEWKGFWKPLMERGRDFYEYKAVRETKNAVIELVFPRDIGNVEIDEPSFSIDRVTWSRETSKTDQKVIIALTNPEEHQKYLFNLVLKRFDSNSATR